MAHTKRPYQVLIVVVIVLLIIPAPVTAQGGPSKQLPLTQYNPQGEVTVDGQEYTIYEYESPIPSIGGIVIYANGRPVENRNTAEMVLSRHARGLAVAKLSDSELKNIRQVRDQARAINRTVTNAIERINNTLALKQELKQTPVNNSTAWKVAIDRIPELDQGYTASVVTGGIPEVVELRQRLLEWRTASQNFERNASKVITLVHKQRNGSKIDTVKLYNRYDAMFTSLQRMQEISSELQTRLSEKAKQSREIAKAANKVPKVEDKIANQFSTLAKYFDDASDAASKIQQSIQSELKSLGEVEQRASSIKEPLLMRWEPPTTPRQKIYAGVGEGVILLLAGILTVLRMRPS